MSPDAAFTVLDPLHERVDVAAVVVDALQHRQYGLVGAAVQGTEQGVDAAGDRGEQVGLAGADQPHRGGGAVLFMVGVQDEQHVQSTGDQRVDLEGRGGNGEGHPQKVLHVAQGVVGIHQRLPDRLLVSVRRDRGELGHEPDRGDLHLLRVQGIEAVLIERRQAADGCGQHRHRMGVAGEAIEESAHVLV